MKNKVTSNTTLVEILKHPGAKKILAKHNFPCLECPMAKLEIESLEIGRVCKVYGIDFKKLLEELNKL
ncbi:DUF1858 domain-containing protein [Patescibacteria group bacterium]